MEVISNLSEKDYIRVVFAMAWRKRAIKFCLILFILIFISGCFNVAVLKTGDAVSLLFPILFLCVFFGSIYFSAKRTFKSDLRIRETIRYVFDDTKLSVQGESFKSTLNWDKVHKVTRSKHWLLIWQNNILANPISMLNIDEQKLDYLRGVLKVNNVQNNI